MMKAYIGKTGLRASVGLGFLAMVLVLLSIGPVRAEDVKHIPASGVTGEEALQLGERMYRQGILPSGEPMQAVVKGDIPVAGTTFSCVSCHLHSGLGSIEGSVITPPANGKKLFQPYKIVFYTGYFQKADKPLLYRPAYTDESLARAIGEGVDPTGRILSEVMPRYLLGDKDMAILIAYLKSLSSQFSPGVSPTTLHLATVVSADVSPGVRRAMMRPLEAYIVNWNRSAYAKKIEEGMTRYSMESSVSTAQLSGRELAYRKLALSLWVLKGPRETWRSQLEEYYRKNPVFALVGGITSGDWEPVHDFCEAHQIPSLFPFTDFPVISESDWYTQYLSKGYYQEGEGAARYLNATGEPAKGGEILQIVRDSREGRALAAGFQKTLRDEGDRASSISLKTGETLSSPFLSKVLAEKKPDVVMLWDGPGALGALEDLAADHNRPRMVFVSSRYMGKSIWGIKDQARDFTYITYPFRLRRGEAAYVGHLDPTMEKVAQDDARQIVERDYAVIQVLGRALMDMKGKYYRDYFLDVIGMMEDQNVSPYERLSFGPGQRYASKGCYIVQITKGPKPEFVRKSDWVIY
jgi:Periplasmic binding protein